MLPHINTPFEYAAGSLGASPDELKLVFSFLLSYPLAAVLKRIPDSKPQLKQVFIVCAGLFYLVGLFDLWAGIRTLFISAAGAYAIAYYLSGPIMPWLGFIFIMGHMSINHIYRHRYAVPGEIDISGPQMVAVMKLTAFCWNVHDGRLREQDIGDFQKEHRLKKMPSFLDYTAYVLFFPSLMVGPAFDYVEYERYIETTMFDLPPGTDPAKAPPTRKKRRVPRSGTPAAMKCGTGLAWLLAYILANNYYYPDLLLSPEYTSYNFLRRVFMMHMVNFVVRMKYYAVWTLAEGGCIMSGIGYKGVNEKTGRVDWDRLQNVNPWGIELAQNSRAYLGNWNINTNNWLRSYVYLRVTPKGKKPGFRASLATFTTSAFWHGFLPGYYMTFVLAAFVQTVAKHFRRMVRPFFLHPSTSAPMPNKRYYDALSWLATQLAFSFVTVPFVLLTFPSSTQAWAAVYFYAIIGTAVCLAFFNSPGKGMLRQDLAKRAKAAGMTTPGASTLAVEKSRGELEPLMPGQDRENVRGPHLGLPEDPGGELDEIMEEIKKEVELRRRRGQSISQGLQEATKDKIAELKREGGEQGHNVANQLDRVLDGVKADGKKAQ